jgi:hypothetical protein
MLQPKVVSFHPYPDDQLLPLVQAEYSQPVNSKGKDKVALCLTKYHALKT